MTAKEFIKETLAEYHEREAALDRYVSITWEGLKEMRDGEALVPGRWYRITDYVTTVSSIMEPNARSAGHPFDIIVMALDRSTLSETAFAIQHQGDTYFAGSDLAAWEIRYSLDNIQWSAVAGTYVTEEEDGHTLIQDGTVTIGNTEYLLWKDLGHLMEEYGVEYAVSEDSEVGTSLLQFDPDTQEIVQDGWSSSIESVQTVSNGGTGTITWMKDEFENECPYDFKNIQFKRWKVSDSVTERTDFNNKYYGAGTTNLPAGLSVPDDTDFIWAFTFSSDDTGGTQTDKSLRKSDYVYGNVIKRYKSGLNNNVFFGQGCTNNTFGQNCHGNTFGQSCSSNSFGNSCNSNSFGQGCYGNTFGLYCAGNTFGQSCHYNSFGTSCNNNSFGNSCNNNSFGQNCLRNTFRPACNNNTFGQNCQNNTFGHNCQQNTFGQSCSSNSFGQYCQHNSFGQSCASITLNKDNMRFIIIEGQNQYVTLDCSKTTSSSKQCKNVRVAQGVNVTTTRKTITVDTVNQDYQTVYKPTNSVEIPV